MEREVIRCIVQPYVPDGVIALLARVFEHRSLKYRHADRALNPWIWFTRMNQFCLDTLEFPGHNLLSHLRHRLNLRVMAVSAMPQVRVRPSLPTGGTRATGHVLGLRKYSKDASPKTR